MKWNLLKKGTMKVLNVIPQHLIQFTELVHGKRNDLVDLPILKYVYNYIHSIIFPQIPKCLLPFPASKSQCLNK